MVRIGITSTDGPQPDDVPSSDQGPYVRAIERAGATPVLLANDAASVDAVLADVGGLLLTGGLDVDPARYGGNPDHANKEKRGYSAERDAFEIALARAARARGVPLLGICRGAQIVNVAFGGTLVEDLRERMGEGYTINHRQTYENGQDRSDYAPGHDVVVAPDSAFARAVGSARFAANSMHHQALATIGEGLAVVGRTEDGVVEAIEPTFAHPFFYAVQWHPEELARDPVSERVFEGLVRAAAERAVATEREG